MRDGDGTAAGVRSLATGSLRSHDADVSMPAGIRAQILTDLFTSGEHVVAWASAWERGEVGARRSSRHAGALVLTNERLLFVPNRAPRRWLARREPSRLPSQMRLREFTQVRTTPSREETRVEIFCADGIVWELFEAGHRSSLAGALYAQRRALDA
jgi:hypothetical protein